MENNLSKMKLKFHLKSKALLVIGKENIHIKKNILNNIKLKSKLKFSLNKEIKTKQDIKEESKENIFIPFAPKIKKQILRNHKNLKKIPSTNCIHTSSKNKIKLIRTMNYSLREENDKKNTSLTNTTFQENNIPRVKSLKHINDYVEPSKYRIETFYNKFKDATSKRNLDLLKEAIDDFSKTQK